MSKILIVDDVSDNVKLLAYNLMDEGYKTISAFRGDQALELAATERPDLILLDIMMPEMDGIEVCRRLKSDHKLCSIPVIMVSAKDEDASIIQGLDVGAHDYIPKPFNWPIVAARVAAALRIKKSHDLILEMNRNLDLAKIQAENANKRKSAFLANMSHEIRTPMTTILGFAEELVSKSLGGDESQDAIHAIYRNGEYLLELLNDILDLSKIESGKLEIEEAVCSIPDMLNNVMTLMVPRAEAKSIALTSTCVGPIPETVIGDATRLKQILVNLISNAIKFTYEGGIRIESTLVGQDTPHPKLQFDVIDTGIGINKEHAAIIFEPFSQAEKATTRLFGGTGLGLNISSRFARMMGGNLELVRSEPKVGSCFRLTVEPGPLEGVRLIHDLSDDLKENSQQATKSVCASNSDRIECRILLAEDGVDNQRLFKHILAKAGAEVVVVENGQLAVEHALDAVSQNTPYDIILMDMQMPVLNGYEATRTLRQNNYRGPIIALTANTMKADRDQCFIAGCSHFVGKPVNRNMLIQTIRDTLLSQKGHHSYIEEYAPV